MIAEVSGSHCRIRNTENLAQGSVGAISITVNLSEEWQELSVIAVFKAYDTAIDAIVTGDGAEIQIPHEVLEIENAPVYLGFDGKLSSGTVVRRTVPVLLGHVQHTLEPSEENEAEATPSVVAQIEATAAEALAIVRSIQEAAANGDFDGAPGADGSKFWTTTVEPLESIAGTFTFQVSDLAGATGTPAVGDLIFCGSAYYPIASISGHGVFIAAVAERRVPIGNGDELPAAPGTAGAYVLKCTVTNGTPAYSWAAAE